MIVASRSAGVSPVTPLKILHPMKTATQPARKIHGLAVLSRDEAAHAGFESITTPINATTEAAILAGVARHRDPSRAVWIALIGNHYELAILRGDIARNPEAEEDDD